jgi:sensor histidine kinase YesM
MHEIVIGKHTLESLTTGMYSDPFVIYREYIQNAADSIDSAIKAGVLCKGDDCIDIHLHLAEKRITIRDNGVGMTEEQCREILQKDHSDRTGIGIKNVNDRIKIYFGDEYGLKIESELDEGTVVIIRMPKVKEEVENGK